ncbi:class I SAM-dependent methyltransferase [Nodosilinea sp. FACHB-13]|uniref:class I SAM-dependent methyltransferase n=1 Tax=Cyanophyceae TaxID=3028117 RepID=UPI001684FD0C|nr:class I SAM-dependent methyltransferase [Nodosilinea sp. FACHB-13]MBD2107736.1 methyltransferase domain-containing protein [Nodosilinea sp. FACHB-13]
MFEAKVGTRNEEARILWLEQALTKIPKGSRILDAGAGEQQFKRFCSHFNYVSQDFAKYDGSGDSKGLQMGSWDQNNLDIICDITSIPEPDSSFDAILCTEVFEHLPDPLLALKEFTRLLRPNGYLIITAPFCSLTHFSPYHYYSGFNRYFYEFHLAQDGFEIVDLQANGNFFEYLAQEIRRIPYVASTYSNNYLRIWERLALKLLLNALERFSDKDKGSSALLSFGFHVMAVKKKN